LLPVGVAVIGRLALALLEHAGCEVELVADGIGQARGGTPLLSGRGRPAAAVVAESSLGLSLDPPRRSAGSVR